MTSLVELTLAVRCAPLLVTPGLALGDGVQVAVLVEGGRCRVRLSGAPSAVASAEASLWRRLGDAEGESGWSLLDPRGCIRGGFTIPQLRAWRASGYLHEAQPVRHQASSGWLQLSELLTGRLGQLQATDAMDLDEATRSASDELAQRRAAHQFTVDTAMPDAPAVAADAADAVLLVVDTCVLMSRLTLLKVYVEALSCSAIVLVPWAALRELDGLKCSPLPSVAKLARDATHALEALLREKHPCFRGQTPGEAHAARSEAAVCSGDPQGRLTGDEFMLGAVMSLRRRGTRAVLLTNDTNLRLRAAVCRLPALPEYALPGTAQELAAVAALDVDEVAHEDTTTPLPPVQAPASACTGTGIPRGLSAREVVTAALGCVERGAAGVFEALYRAEFGTFWEVATMEPQPWDGRCLLRMLRKNWQVLFKEALPRQAQSAGAAMEEAMRDVAQARRAANGEAELRAARRVAAAARDLLVAVPAQGGAVELAAARTQAAALCAELQEDSV